MEGFHQKIEPPRAQAAQRGLLAGVRVRRYCDARRPVELACLRPRAWWPMKASICTGHPVPAFPSDPLNEATFRRSNFWASSSPPTISPATPLSIPTLNRIHLSWR
jgi:hypothetical protein